MLYDRLRQRLSEFFVDVTDANVDIHLGDLFDPSHFRLQDVFLKTELINALHFPFELQAAYIGDIKVEGLLGLVAGSPLTIGVDNICLVLSHKPVDWHNDLALRYAKELLLAVLQRVPLWRRAADKHKGTTTAIGDASFSVSPVKWLLSKMQATIAETTVKFERLHIRFEGEHEGQLMAYGVQIPTVQLSTRDLDDPILQRREQPGVKYPTTASDTTACKRLYLANISLYCDLHATSFLGPASPTQPATTASPPLSPTDPMEFLRQQCLAPFAPNVDRDLVLISALWLKLDFVRSASATVSSWGLGAVDIVTEPIHVNVDLTQCAALTDELARVTDFFEKQQRRTWRPSAVDRTCVAPPRVTLSSAALLPVEVSADLAQLASIATPPRWRNRAWLRGMWRYAARCIMVALHNGDAKRVRLGSERCRDEGDYQPLRRQAEHRRYVELYTRSLGEEGLKICTASRTLLPASPRAVETRLPVYAPLTLAEQWELSDFVENMTVYDQRVLRLEAAQRVRHDVASYQAGSPPSAQDSGSGVPSTTLSIEIPTNSTEPSSAMGAARGASGASISPKQSPRHEASVASLPIEFEFVANHHHHYTQSCAELSPSKSPTKRHGLSPPSPVRSTSSYPPHLSHSASAPIARHNPPTPTKMPLSFRAPPSPSRPEQPSFLGSLLPSWLLQPSRIIPLLNWHLGPLALRLHHRPTVAETVPIGPTPKAVSSDVPDVPPRSSETFLDFHVDGCTGCALLSKTPSVSVLVELRLGLVKVAVVHRASSSSSSGPHTGNSLITDYIRDPKDGFVYVGLKYNSKHATSAHDDDKRWDLKAKLCVGTIHIEYNDMALQTAMRTQLQRRASFSSKSSSSSASLLSPAVATSVPSIRLDQATYVTVIHDVVSNWKAFIQRVQPSQVPPVPVDTLPSPQKKQQMADQTERTRARIAKLVTALLQQTTSVELSTSGLELQLALLTRTVVDRVTNTNTNAPSRPVQPLAPLPPSLFDSEHIHVALPSTRAGLENRPQLHECQVYAGGARVTFRTTKHGRAAVLDHVLQRLFPVHEMTERPGDT